MPEFIDAGTQDFLTRSTVLRQHGSKRTFFDATNPEHCASLKKFIETGNWGSVQFYPEFPFIDVPMTVLMKFAGHHLATERKPRAALLTLSKEAGFVESEVQVEDEKSFFDESALENLTEFSSFMATAKKVDKEAL